MDQKDLKVGHCCSKGISGAQKDSHVKCRVTGKNGGGFLAALVVLARYKVVSFSVIRLTFDWFKLRCYHIE